MRGMAEFREVLHKWASRQLETKSDHAGPFTIERVWFEFDPGFDSGATFEDDSLSAHIRFKHSDCVERNGAPCTSESWSLFEQPTTIIEMLNELLAIEG